MHLYGDNRKMSFYVRLLSRNEQMGRRFMFMKIFWPQEVVYMYMTKIFRHLLSGNGLADQIQTLCGAK